MSQIPSIFAPPAPAAAPDGGINNKYSPSPLSTPVAHAIPVQNNNYTTTTPASMVATSAIAPMNAGMSHNLPPEVRDAANLNGAEVAAWTHLDPAMEQEIGKFVCWRSFPPVFLCPCFWPHLLIVWPLLCWGKVSMENAAKAQYWILTDRELKIVSLDHDSCCCQGWSTTGNIVKTVPLENITDCGVDARGTGVLNDCAGDVPTIYVDTASAGGAAGREAVGFGLENYNWFIQLVLNQRNIVKGTIGPAAASMIRPGASSINKSPQERIAEITTLKDQGIITQAEFDQKRQEIISSI